MAINRNLNPNLFAGLGPFAGLTQASTEALSRGIGGLFGIKDPEMEAQRAIAMAAQNPNDPATLSNAANILAQAGKIDQAMALAGQARQITRQEQQFGLEQRRVAATERQLEDAALNQAERLSLSREELELKKKELKAREDLNTAQVDRIYAEIERLDKGDYYITEQKGGLTGTETIGFIAVNKRNPNDQVTIPLVKSEEKKTDQTQKLGVSETKSLLLGKPNTEVTPESEVVTSRSSAGQMGRSRRGVSPRIPGPPPMMTRGGRRNPEYDKWEKEFGEAYKAQMAGQ